MASQKCDSINRMCILAAFEDKIAEIGGRVRGINPPVVFPFVLEEVCEYYQF